MTKPSHRILHVIVNPVSQDPNGHAMRRAVETLQARIDSDEAAGVKQPVHLIPIDTQFDWDTDVHNIIVYSDDTPVGAIQFAPVEYHVSDAEEREPEVKYFNMLHTVYVLPEFRSQHLGRMLVNAMEACVEFTTHTEMDVAPTNTDARAFYASCGFRVESIRMVRMQGAEAEHCDELDIELDDEEELAPPVVTFGTPTDLEIIALHAEHVREVPKASIELIRPDHASGYVSFCARVDGEIAAIIQVVKCAMHERSLRRIYARPKFRDQGVETALCQYFNVTPTVQAISMLCRN